MISLLCRFDWLTHNSRSSGDTESPSAIPAGNSYESLSRRSDASQYHISRDFLPPKYMPALPTLKKYGIAASTRSASPPVTDWRQSEVRYWLLPA